jgi:prevent-host-death family protein
MAKVVNLCEAKSRLSALVEEAAAGREIVIAKAGVPRARLVPAQASTRRRPGGSKGKTKIADDFEAPLPASLLRAFGGGTVPPRTRRR